ncbi:MAG: IPT/TIG domain-containing protein, partial [Minicystis sp.]
YRSRWLLAGPASLFAAGLALAACINIAPDGIHRQTDGDAGDDDGGISVDDASPPENPPPSEAGTSDPHAVVGTEPSHGPFAGGQRVLIHGKGFSSKARVWFGEVPVDPATLIAIDPSRMQIGAPEGKAGPVDISVQNGDDASTRRTLMGGYTYDALYAVPDKGPVPGGTVIEILGQGTSWDGTSIVKIDQKPCTAQTIESPTVISCTVPAGSPGSKTISVTTGNEKILVLDAYTYEDSDNGYKGGLSGDPLAGQLKVLVFDNYSGDPIPEAHVIVGKPIESAIVAKTNAAGVVGISDISLDKPVTVTVSARCHSPISFVAEPVDTVTAYLDPVLSPACAGSGDPPPVGGKPQSQGTIKGELVWQGAVEFKKALWNNVPQVKNANEKRTAYVFYATTDPGQSFNLPAESAQITQDTPGDLGYAFGLSAPPGNRAVYALAGIEDRTKNPPSFTAYVMGVAKGVPVLPNAITDSVFLSMVKTLDKALIMDLHTPPPGPKGPDRLRATTAIQLGNDGYALLPGMVKSPLLPVMGLLPFVGVPSLDGDLSATQYVSSAKAQTGPTGTTPISAIARILSTSTATPILVDGFIHVPTLVTPKVNGAWDGMHLAVDFSPGGAPIQMTIYDVQSGNGLVHWLVAVPQGSNAVELPDLTMFPDDAMPPGPVTIGVYGANYSKFDYNKLIYRQLRTQGMSAYALDYFAAHL